MIRGVAADVNVKESFTKLPRAYGTVGVKVGWGGIIKRRENRSSSVLAPLVLLH